MHQSPIPASAVSLLRRFTALLVTLLLFQANWQESGVACVTGHEPSHHVRDGVPVPSTGGAVVAHAAMTRTATADGATEHDASRLLRAPNDAGDALASSLAGTKETLPSHCPDSGMPADCAAMMACSAAAASTSAGSLLTIEGLVASERVVASDARPHSRHTVPDVPPPRA